MRNFRIAALILVAGLGAAGLAVAQSPSASENQTTLATIIVTAQKYAQNEQEVPITITALTGAQLANRGITDTEDLSKTSPGLLVTELGGSPYQTLMSIRGVNTLDFGLQQESPIALYIDGAYMSFESATGFGFYDVKDVQILRGPQGTLFGRNTTGGLIQITNNTPTNYFTGYLQLGQGSYNEHKLEGVISGPLSKRIDARFSFLYNQQNGYIHNTMGPSFGTDKTLSVRLQFQYTISKDTKDLLKISGLRTFPIPAGVYFPFASAPNPANHGLTEPNSGALFVQNCASLGYTVAPGATNCLGEHLNPRPWQISDPRIGFLRRWFGSVTNTFTHYMPWATLTSITNYTYFNQHYLEDDANGPQPIFAFAEGENAHQVSEEVRLNGQTKRAHWVLGAYYLTIPGHYLFPVLLPPFNKQFQINPFVDAGPIFDQNVSTYALYGQSTYAITPRWKITLGGRVERDRKSMDLTNFCLVQGQPGPATCTAYGTVPSYQFVSGTIANTEWSGNFQLQYQLSSDVMFYAGIRRGTKDGELTISDYPFPGETFNDFVIKPEILTDTEAGFKSTLLENRLRLNGDVFYYHYNDYQAFKTVGISPVLFNAQARDYGAEMTVKALLTPTLTAGVDFAYLHTKVMGVTLPDGTVSNDQQQPLAPHVSVNASLRKMWNVPFGTFFSELDATYVGGRYFSTVNAPLLHAGGYWTGNFTAGYTTPNGKWTASLAVDNINDKAYKVDIFDNTPTAGYGMYNLAPPRWVLGQIRYSF